MRRTLFALLAVVALAGAACGGGGDSADGGGNGGNGGPTSDCEDLSSGDVFEVTIADFAFEPACVKAKTIQTITISNEDDVAHTFTIEGTNIDLEIDAGMGAFTTGFTLSGEATGIVEPGTYTFICRFHAQMKGEITIV